MIRVPFEAILTKIKSKTGKSDEEVKALIKEKQSVLSGLITEQGAAQIVASELGINIYEEYSGKVKIDKIIAGMRSIEVVGKVMNIFPVKTFTTKDGREGKVAGVILADETGRIRLTLWNDLTDLLSSFKEGDILQLKDVGSKQNQERVELQLFGREQCTVNPKGVSIDVKETSQGTSYAPAKEMHIKDIVDNEENVQILGNIVGVYDPRFFETCPECGKRAREEQGKFVCPVHGDVQPQLGAVLNMAVDDGTGSIRVSLFTNQINHLIGFSNKTIDQFKESSFEEIKDNLLGEFVKVVGRAIKSEAFDRIELRAQLVFLDPDTTQ